MKEKYLSFLKKVSDQFDDIIYQINGADIEIKIDFEKTLKLYDKLKHEDLSEFCQNEAFGYFLVHGNNTKKNRQMYAKAIEEYIKLKRQ